MKRHIFIVLVLCICCIVQQANAQGILYVDSSAAAGGNGSSWANALPSLADAVLQANTNQNIDTILIAKGTYYPESIVPTASATTDRDKSFYFSRGGLAVIGGYPNGGGARDWQYNPVTLSGDVGIKGDSTDNSHHVILSVGGGSNGIIDSTLYFDGITINGGNANAVATSIMVNGVGIAGVYGGGVYNNDASPTFVNCTITGNRTDEGASNAGHGGGMYNDNHSNVHIINSRFSSNRSLWCGGLLNDDSSFVYIENTVFAGNRATFFGGGMGILGGSYTMMVNCVFSGNSCDSYGSAIYNGDSLVLINNTISGNNDVNGVIYNSPYANLAINNSIVYGNANGITSGANSVLSITNSLVQGNTNLNNGNIDDSVNPFFIEPISYMIAPTIEGDYHLQMNSPLINKGSNDALLANDTTDFDGKARIAGDTVDMGAYEYAPFSCPSFHTVYVDSALNHRGDGSSWANALASLAVALRMAGQCPGIDTILIAKGVYYPEFKPLFDTPVSDRYRTFYFSRGGLAVIGGYPNGGGTRNINNNPVVLSGDIDIKGDSTDNAYHVILAVGSGTNGTIDSSLYFDGITVTGGNANAVATSIMVNGAGISGVYGGGVYNNDASSTFANCTITGNRTDEGASNAGHGGGMYNVNHSNVHIIGSRFSNNRSLWCGGLLNDDSSFVHIENTVFAGNRATFFGGGMGILGGSNTMMVNCIFSGNSCNSYGSAIYNGDSLILINNTISGNNDVNGVIYNGPFANLSVSNSIVYGNANGITSGANSTLSIAYSLVQGNTDTSNGNINDSVNPQFIGQLSYTSAPTTEGDYRLEMSSPLINKGDNGILPTGDTTDLDGKTRVDGDTIDLGAYEYIDNAPLPLTLLNFNVKPAGNCNAIVSWQTANDQEVVQYIIEQSTDATTYTTAGTQSPTDNATGSRYQLSLTVEGSVTYFRLKILNKDGSNTYSKVAMLTVSCGLSEIEVYPNPVHGTLYVKHGTRGMGYTVLGLNGKVVMKGELGTDISMIPASGLSPGIYLLHITAINGTGETTFKFIKL